VTAVAHPLLNEPIEPSTLAGPHLQSLPTRFKYYGRLGHHSQRSAVNGWKRFCGAAKFDKLDDLRKLTTEDIEAIQEVLRETHAMSTARLTLTLAKQVWRYCRRVGFVTSDPFKDAEPLRGKNNVPLQNVLFPGELEKLEGKLPIGSFDRALITVLTRQGWREHVLTQLALGNIQYNGTQYTAVYMTKGDKQRTQVLARGAVEAAKAWRKAVNSHTGPEDPFLPGPRGDFSSESTIYRHVVDICEAHLGRGVTPHGLRATFISSAIQRHGLEAARQLAGHESIATTQRYSRWVVVDAEKGMTK